MSSKKSRLGREEGKRWLVGDGDDEDGVYCNVIYFLFQWGVIFAALALAIYAATRHVPPDTPPDVDEQPMGYLFAADDTIATNDGCGVLPTDVTFNNIIINQGWIPNIDGSFTLDTTGGYNGTWMVQATIFPDQSFESTSVTWIIASIQYGGAGPFIQIPGSTSAEGQFFPSSIYSISTSFLVKMQPGDTIIIQFGCWQDGNEGCDIVPWNFNIFGCFDIGVDYPISAKVSISAIET